MSLVTCSRTKKKKEKIDCGTCLIFFTASCFALFLFFFFSFRFLSCNGNGIISWCIFLQGMPKVQACDACDSKQTNLIKNHYNYLHKYKFCEGPMAFSFWFGLDQHIYIKMTLFTLCFLFLCTSINLSLI